MDRNLRVLVRGASSLYLAGQIGFVGSKRGKLNPLADLLSYLIYERIKNTGKLKHFQVFPPEKLLRRTPHTSQQDPSGRLEIKHDYILPEKL